MKDLLLGELKCWLDESHDKVCSRTGRRSELCWYFNIITRNLLFYVWNSCSQYLIIPEMVCSECSKV